MTQSAPYRRSRATSESLPRPKSSRTATTWTMISATVHVIPARANIITAVTGNPKGRSLIPSITAHTADVLVLKPRVPNDTTAGPGLWGASERLAVIEAVLGDVSAAERWTVLTRDKAICNGHAGKEGRSDKRWNRELHVDRNDSCWTAIVLAGKAICLGSYLCSSEESMWCFHSWARRLFMFLDLSYSPHTRTLTIFNLRVSG
jgi:hypothetical protein